MKSFQTFISESTVPIWSGAIRRKPQAYADGFIELWKSGHLFQLKSGKGYVTLKQDPKLINVLQKAAGDGLQDDELISVMKDGGWNFNGTTALIPIEGDIPNGIKEPISGHISLNDVDKENVRPQATPTGAQWESLIAIGYNMISLKQENPIPDNYKDYGLDSPEVIDKFWQQYGKVSLKLGKAFHDYFNGKMIQFGAGSVQLSGDWKKWGGSNKTPKTDMYTDNSNISLKKKGGSQLMSAQKGEAMATFHAAMELMGSKGDNKKYIQNIVSEVEQNFKTVIMDGNIGDLQKGTGFAAKLDKKELQRKKDEVKQMDAVHEKLTALMDQAFNGTGSGKSKEFHQNFREHFVFEAASGLRKFSGTRGTASHLVEFAENGTISQYKSMGDVSGISNFMISSEIKKMAKQVNFYVSFKTGSKNPYSALRGGISKKPIKEEMEILEIPTLRDLVFEQLREDSNVVLTEGYEELNEWALLRKAYDKIKKVGTKTKGWVQDKAAQAVTWLRDFIAGLWEKVKRVLDRIVQMGRRALHFILNFFGIQPSQVTSSGPALAFHKM